MTWTSTDLTCFSANSGQSTLYCGTLHLHLDYHHRTFCDLDISQRCTFAPEAGL